MRGFCVFLNLSLWIRRLVLATASHTNLTRAAAMLTSPGLLLANEKLVQALRDLHTRTTKSCLPFPLMLQD
eukprot:g15079.t1